MSSPDFNIAKFNIPINVQRAFDKGKIADSYRQMYLVAVDLASTEAKARQFLKYGEYCRNILNTEDEGHPSLGKIMKGVADYQNKRIHYHMNNMIQMLELYVRSREAK